jgi:hypothetical protein
MWSMAPTYTPSYFADHYDDLRWPLASSDAAGVRPAQADALNAMTILLFQPDRFRALVSMPVGSGNCAHLEGQGTGRLCISAT